MKRLNDILTEAGLRPIPDAPDVHAITLDSRQVRPGSLYVAVRGVQVDGRIFIEDAVRRGAVAVAAAGAVSTTVPVIRLNDDRYDAGRLLAAFHGRPSSALRVVGVTGTNGKTTTTWLLDAVLTEAGLNPGLLGTIHNRIGETPTPSALTTLGPEALHAALADMRCAGRDAAVMEVSSHALDQDRIAGVELDVAVFTNVTRDHLDYHGDLVAYRAAKARLRGHVVSGGAVVLNADDPVQIALADGLPEDVRVLRYARRIPADLRANVLESDASGTALLLTDARETVAVRTSLVGAHNVENVLAAATAAMALGIDLRVAARGLESFTGVPGRLECVAGDEDLTVFVDYAHTPDALRRVLSAARAFASGRVVCLFGCGGEKDRGKRPEMGRIAEAVADRVILSSDNPRGEDPAVIANEVLAGCRRPAAIALVEDRTEAVRFALDTARPGDVVLLCGKGHETFQERDGRREDYDEPAVVRDWWAEQRTKIEVRCS